MSDWPLVDAAAAAPTLPDSVDRALGTFGLHASAIDMDRVLPSTLCAWALGSLLLRRWGGKVRAETA